MEEVEGGYVGWDCRPGDVITRRDGHSYGVEVTTKEYVIVAATSTLNPVQGSYQVSYQELRDERAYYAARRIPCRPPVGETKV